MTKHQQLGKYKIEEQIGSGAYADVYRAQDTALKRTVALKVLKPMLLADEEAFARFVQEAQTAAGLFHPHIATVLDFGEAEGRYYIAIRYVDGPSLDKLLAQNGPLPWEEALEITEQIADALQFAHDKGLIHRDVKPQNILISENEGAVLTDFGLVKAMASSGMTTTGTFLGTPNYMAPEIWKDEDITPAVDQYALACALVEMLTGKVLYGGKTPPAVMAKHFQSPHLLETWTEVASGRCIMVIEKALSRKPEDRFEDVSTYVEKLQTSIGQTNSRFSNIPAGSDHIKIHDEYESVTLRPGVEMFFVHIPAGGFLMGEGDKQQKTYLDEYWIGRFPVTNAQFKAFIDVTGQKTPFHWKKGKIPRGKGEHPVVYVSWHDAHAFCQWASQVTNYEIRLPTMIEWEKAARGTDGRTYPWGNIGPAPWLCNYNNNIGDTSQVGRYSPEGDSPYGCADMAGNVKEWTNSLYKDFPYNKKAEFIDGDADVKRIRRGGSFRARASIRSAYSRHQSTYPNLRDLMTGFRVVIANLSLSLDSDITADELEKGKR